MIIYTFKLGQYQSNCYFLSEGSDCIIIDPGDCGNFICEKISELRLKPHAIIATHGHFDHLMAVGEIQLSYNIPLYINEKDTFLIDRLEETAQFFLGFCPAIIKPKRIKFFSNEILYVSCFKLRVIYTPGHTPGSVSIFNSNNKSSKILFSGDTLFSGGIGRYDFSYSSKKELKNSLKKLLLLPDETIIYPGHGEPTTLKKEKDFILSFF